MSGEERRKQIIEKLGEQPVSAGKLAEAFGVSRQVIVQDVALLRAEGEPVLSTSRGYVRAGGGRHTRVFKVRHTDEQVLEELQLIVDAGGRVDAVAKRRVPAAARRSATVTLWRDPAVSTRMPAGICMAA